MLNVIMECRILLIVMLNVIMLSVANVMLNVIVLNVVLLNVVVPLELHIIIRPQLFIIF